MALPDSVARAITGFLGFLEGTLPSRTRSNMILGTENMAKIFRYGEMIELDPAGLIREAEKQMRRLEIELDNLERSGALEPSGRAVRLDSVLDTIGKLEGIGGRAASGRGSIALEPARTLGPQPPKNENLGIPAPRARLVSLVSVSPLSPEPCGLTLLYDENASNELRLLYDALGALSAREERRRLCAGRDSVRALLGSDLYSEIVRFMEIDDLIGAFPDERIRLRAMLIGEKRAALARMRLLFGIHAGTMTTEAARDYLVRTLSIGTDEAAAEVMTATYAPTAADPGIALIYLEQMLKEAAKRRDSIGPETRVRRALEEHYYLPPAMIIRYVEP
jgi:hypothetical protein